MTTTISIRPVQIVGHKFSDGVSLFETETLLPVAAWGIFIDHSDGTMSGLAYDRASAIAAATAMAEQHGWRITHIAPEAGAAGGGTLQ